MVIANVTAALFSQTTNHNMTVITVSIVKAVYSLKIGIVC